MLYKIGLNKGGKMKILISIGKGTIRDTFFPPHIISQIENIGEVVYNDTESENFTKEQLCEKIKDIDIIFTSWGAPCIDEQVLQCANNLKIHAHTGGSVATVTSQAEYEKGITILSGNNIFAKSVAEGCLSYTLFALRKTNIYIDMLKTEGWSTANWQTNGLIGKKIGLVGYGAIAKYFAELLQWFEPELYICSNYITQAELDKFNAKKATAIEIFETCDVISFHSALNDKTKGMYTAKELKHIKDGALFVNTARAGIFNEQDLYNELKKERFNAIIDVYHTEPLPNDNPLREMNNVILMPQMAGPTTDLRQNVTQALIYDINKINNNQVPNNIISLEHATRMTK